MSDDSTANYYLWAATPARNDLPGRLEVTVCPGCGAVVAAERTEVHLRWHRNGATS